MIDVLVVLRRQAALPTARMSRSARLVAVVRMLRNAAHAEQRAVVALLARREAVGRVSKVRPFWIFDGLQVVAQPRVIAELAARPDVAAIRPNVKLRAPISPSQAAGPEWSIARDNAPALWGLGFRGQGVVVANMDTGVDITHPDLGPRWRGGSNSWFDPSGEHPTTPTDTIGHGTSTMGVMVGGAAGGTDVGVAPDARWIAVKIFDDLGIATAANIHAGFQWLLDPDGNPATPDAPNVVNNSWGRGLGGCNLEFQPDLANLRAAGILPIFAAGNSGPASATSVSPANNPEAFAVGATDVNDVVAPISSRGPSACGQPIYPQVVAPGVHIHTTDTSGLYTTQTGTSLAAPQVAGTLALLLSAVPGASVDRQQSALAGGTVDLGAGGPDDAYGNGRLDALAAYNRLLAGP
jgi:subtilisin family serine protease